MKEFLDEYKRLEKLCSELYNQQHGVSLYIADMEATPANLSIMVPSWHVDLKTLKHLRHIRNAMVHDLTDQNVSYTQEDIRNIKEFYQRIMNQQDPLALLRHGLNSHEPPRILRHDLNIQESLEKPRERQEVYAKKRRVPNKALTNSSDENLSIKEGLIISLIVLIVVLITVGILVARDCGLF